MNDIYLDLLLTELFELEKFLIYDIGRGYTLMLSVESFKGTLDHDIRTQIPIYRCHRPLQRFLKCWEKKGIGVLLL